MALGSAHPLTQMRTMRRKGGRCVGLTSLSSSCVDFLEIWEPQAPGNLRFTKRPVQGLLCLHIAII